MTQAGTPALRMEGITKSFGAVRANDGISFTVGQGEVIALLGENGAGKTTLMNILFGQYRADAGHVEVQGRPLPPGQPRAALEAGVGMVHQHFTLAENLRVWENIALGSGGLWSLSLRARAAKARIRALSAQYHLTVDPDARVGALSVGERQRVEILKALYRDAKVLILDEPTAVLTPQEADALFASLREGVAQGLSVVFISHKLHEVMAIADRVLVLRQGQLVAERAIGATSPAELSELMVGAKTAPPEVTPAKPGAPLLALRAVSTQGEGQQCPLRGVDLALRAGQITGLAGVSGNGQAALCDLIAGLGQLAEGALEVAGQPVSRWSVRQALDSGIARIPEDRHKTGAIGDFDLTENAILERYASGFSRGGWMDWRGARRFAEAIITDYDVRCPGPDVPIRLLSGGNMQKLILGRALGPELGWGAQVILANQPVRGLDIGAVNAVHARLMAARDAGAAVLLVSEDLDEILKLSDVIRVISEGQLSPEFARGAVDAAELGHWMAGGGADAA